MTYVNQSCVSAEQRKNWKCSKKSLRIWWRKLLVPTQITRLPYLTSEILQLKVWRVHLHSGCLESVPEPCCRLERTPETLASQRCESSKGKKFFQPKCLRTSKLTEGDVVRMHEIASLRWKAQIDQGSRVKQQVDARSYAVRTEDGRLFRRNCRHFRKSREPFMSKDDDVAIPNPIMNFPPTEVNTEPAPLECRTGHPTAMSSKKTDSRTRHKPQCIYSKRTPYSFP